MPVGRPVTLLVLFWAALTPARAQHYAEIFGHIVDPSEAGVIDAVITVVDEATGYHHQVLSEADGTYAIGSLLPAATK